MDSSHLSCPLGGTLPFSLEMFIARPTFNATLITIDGLILYCVDIITNHPKSVIVPWFLHSDHNEQLFAKMRTGAHAGRRQQLDNQRVPSSMGKYNKLLELEESLSGVPQQVAHTRGKTLFKDTWKKREGVSVEKGCDLKMSVLLSHMEKGSKAGEALFLRCSNYPGKDLIEDEHRTVGLRLAVDESESDSSDDDNMTGDVFSDSDPDEPSNIKVRGKTIHIKAAIAKYCNGGRTTFGNKSRGKRLICSGSLDKYVGLSKSMCVTSPTSMCKVVCCREELEGTFVCKGSKAVEIVGKGEVIRLTVAVSIVASKEQQRRLASSLCLTHPPSYHLWVHINGRVYNCVKFSEKSSGKRVLKRRSRKRDNSHFEEDDD